MSHEQELSMAAPYVLDALDDLDRARFERHLAQCEECVEEVAALRSGLDEIADATALAPPPHVRAQVLEQIETIEQEPRVEPVPIERPRTWSSVALAAIAALVIAIGAVLVTSTDPLDELLALPDTRVVAVGVTDAYAGSGSVDAVVSGDSETVYLRLENLEAPSDGTVYAAWLIGDNGADPAGLFVPDSDGAVTLVLDGSAGEGVAVGITLEPAGGSPLPTTDVLFLGVLG